MKPLVLVFSLLLLLLSAVPCCSIAETFGIFDQHEEKHSCGSDEDKSCGDCGQFSSCSLCMGFLLPSLSPFDFISIYPMEKEKSFSKIVCEVRTIENAIWQPPRFSYDLSNTESKDNPC
ncbi:MAG: hypothetical protein DI539_05770 [Flavobacterium psychrophilum]|nr:MAG: hypothetical protein DI539_05770 [Flavobacterium psychrophilum]